MQYKIFSVFLSSSFLDMHSERDYLKKHAFAQIDAELIHRGARLRVIDLRGSEKLDAREGMSVEEKVLHMCLEGVDSCRPRLIGLLGDRYGWVPYEVGKPVSRRVKGAIMSIHENTKIPLTEEDMKSRSITDLEIYYGLELFRKKESFLGKKEIPCMDCFFYHRSFTEEAILPADYFEGRERQKTLIEQILDTLGSEWESNFREYAANWDQKKEEIEELSLRALSDMVHDQLLKSILDELNDMKEKTTNPEFETKAYLAFKENDTIERIEANQIFEFVSDATENILLVSGKAGSGKTVLFSQVHKKLEALLPRDDFVFATHVVGLTAQGSTLVGMLEHLCLQMEYPLGIDRKLPEQNPNSNIARNPMDQTQQHSTKEELVQRFAELVRLSAQNHHLVICIDGIDNLLADSDIKQLSFLPYSLPEGCKLVITSQPDFVEVPSRYAVKNLELNGFPEKDSTHSLIEIARTQFGKGWNPRVLKAATKKFLQADLLPLYAEIFVSHLMNITKVEYKEGRFRRTKEHEQWMIEEIRQIPTTIEGAYQILFARLKQDYGNEIVDALLGVISVTRHGIYDEELRTSLKMLTGISLDEYTLLSLRGRLRSHLRQDLQQGWWDFEHQQVRRILVKCEQSIFTKDQQVLFHQCILRGMEEIALRYSLDGQEETRQSYLYSDYLCREYMWHIYQGKCSSYGLEWLSHLPLEREELVYQTLIEIARDGESGIQWLEQLIVNANEAENPLRCVNVVYLAFSDLREYAVRFTDYGKIYHLLDKFYSQQDILNCMDEYLGFRLTLGQYYSFDGNGLKERNCYIKTIRMLAAHKNKMSRAYYIEFLLLFFVLLTKNLVTYDQLEDAEKYIKFTESLVLTMQKKDPTVFAECFVSVFSVYTNLADYYDQRGNHEEAKRWYREFETYLTNLSNELKEHIQDSPIFFAGYLCVARYYLSENIVAEAKHWLKPAEALALNFYHKHPGTQGNIINYAYVCNEYGKLYRMEGNLKNAIEWYLKSEKMIGDLLELLPETPEYDLNYADTCRQIGLCYADDQHQDAEKWLAKSESILRKLHEKNDEEPRMAKQYGAICADLGNYHSSIGNLVEAEKWQLALNKQSKEQYDKHPDTLQNMANYATSCYNIGCFYLTALNTEEAEKWFFIAEEIYRSLLSITKEMAKYVQTYCLICSSLGELYSSRNQLKEAEQWYKRTERYRKKQYHQRPDLSEYIEAYGKVCYDFALLYKTAGKEDKSRKYIEEYEKLIRIIYDTNPESAAAIQSYALTCEHLGNYFDKVGDLYSSIQSYNRYEELAKKLHDEYPDVVKYSIFYGEACLGIAFFHSDHSSWRKAGEYYKKYKDVIQEVYNKNPENNECIELYAKACHELAQYGNMIDKPEIAISWFERSKELSLRLHKKNPHHTVYAQSYGNTSYELAMMHFNADHFMEAERVMKESVKVRRRLYKSKPEIYDYANDYNLSCYMMSLCCLKQGAFDPAELWMKKSEKVTKDLLALDPGNPVFINLSAWICRDLGKVCSSIGKKRASEKWYLKSTELYNKLLVLDPDPYYIKEFADACHSFGDLLDSIDKWDKAYTWYQNGDVQYSKLYHFIMGSDDYVERHVSLCTSMEEVCEKLENKKEAAKWRRRIRKLEKYL